MEEIPRYFLSAVGLSLTIGLRQLDHHADNRPKYSKTASGSRKGYPCPVESALVLASLAVAAAVCSPARLLDVAAVAVVQECAAQLSDWRLPILLDLGSGNVFVHFQIVMGIHYRAKSFVS